MHTHVHVQDFWIALFRKQVDKLQTNYKVRTKGVGFFCLLTRKPAVGSSNTQYSQGIYVLHDYSFRWISRLSKPETDITVGSTSSASSSTASPSSSTKAPRPSLSSQPSPSSSPAAETSIIEHGKLYAAFASGLSSPTL